MGLLSFMGLSMKRTNGTMSLTYVCVPLLSTKSSCTCKWFYLLTCQYLALSLIQVLYIGKGEFEIGDEHSRYVNYGVCFSTGISLDMNVVCRVVIAVFIRALYKLIFDNLIIYWVDRRLIIFKFASQNSLLRRIWMHRPTLTSSFWLNKLFQIWSLLSEWYAKLNHSSDASWVLLLYGLLEFIKNLQFIWRL